MALDSEAICAALAERLQEKLSDVKSVSRRFRPQYLADELPLVVVDDSQGIQELVSDPDDPEPTWRLGMEIVILARTVETDSSPTTQLNGLVRSVLLALERDEDDEVGQYGRPEFYTSLGGKVRGFAVTKVDKGSGALAGSAAAEVQITMEALG